MARASNLTMCSFWARATLKCANFIAGPGVYICDSCINVCKSILDKELNEDARRQSSNIRVPKPAQIREALDQYVIGAGDRQEDPFCGGAQSLQTGAAKLPPPRTPQLRFRRIRWRTLRSRKATFCLSVRQAPGRPCWRRRWPESSTTVCIADATTLTEAGYVGEDVENIILRLLKMPITM